MVLTSNASRELSEALKRRCLYLHVGYPDAEREREIATGQVPDLDLRIAERLVDTVGRLREVELKKAPSIAESVDWARTLVALQVGTLDEATIAHTLGAVLKHASDTERARREDGKPYWVTPSSDGRFCYISWSGTDDVSRISYRTGRIDETVRVGDHPQRIRNGSVRRALVAGLPDYTPPDDVQDPVVLPDQEASREGVGPAG